MRKGVQWSKEKKSDQRTRIKGVQSRRGQKRDREWEEQ